MVIFHGELLNNQMVQECGNCIQDLDFQSALFDGNVFLKAGVPHGPYNNGFRSLT